MSHRPMPPALRRAEARLWTGPLAHLVGGALDVLGALAGAALRRLRAQTARRGGRAPGISRRPPAPRR